MKILIAVDGSKGTARAVERTIAFLAKCSVARIVLVHVQKPEGISILDDLIVSDSEMQTLLESLEGSEIQEKLDRQAHMILEHYRKVLAEAGFTAIEGQVRRGHPAEEIVKAADEAEVDLIVLGRRGARLGSLFMGSVSREVANNTERAVLLVR